MSPIKLVNLSWLILAFTTSTWATESIHTNMNPALLYYQALLVPANLPPEDDQYLFGNVWIGRHLDKRFGELILNYDNAFKLLRQAAQAKVPCDWGIDLTEGPPTLLPYLARAKHLVQVARLRVRWHLQNGRQTEALDDLLAALALGRNLARDRVQISALVQNAIEALISMEVAWNFYQFSPETLQQLIDGMDACPIRCTIAQCLPTAKYLSIDWYLAKIAQFQRENPGDDAKVINQIRALFGHDSTREREPNNSFANRLIKAGGGTSEGVAKRFRELEPLYQKVSDLLALPYGEFAIQMEAFGAEIQKLTNPLASWMVAWNKSRYSEFRIQTQYAMIRAAIEYKLHGEPGFKCVNDPCGNGPFAIRRFVFEGVDRGFELKSNYGVNGDHEELIFVEKGGTPFYVNGSNVGKAVTATPDFSRRYGINSGKAAPETGGEFK